MSGARSPCNVLHVIPSLAAEDGGPPAALTGMVRALAARDVRITVATTTSRDLRPAPPTDAGVIVIAFPRTLPGSWKYSQALGEWLGGNVSRFDIVHVHALFSYATIPAARSAIAQRVPLVLRPLGTLDPWSLAHRSWKKRPYLRLVERRHLDGADAIHVTSELERRGLAALGYERKTRVIPLGVDHAAAPDVVRERRGRSAPGGSVNILFLSRIHPKKGLPLLIEALSRLRDEVPYTLRIAGDGDGSHMESVRRQCVAAGMADRVTFLGHVDGEAKRETLDWADMFVLPSYQENFAVAAVEAMAAGVPVILSDQVGVAPDAAATGAGLMVPTDAPLLAAAIRTVANDPALRLRMGLAAVSLVERRFTWSAAADSLIELYRELIARQRERATVAPSVREP